MLANKWRQRSFDYGGGEGREDGKDGSGLDGAELLARRGGGVENHLHQFMKRFEKF